MAEIKYSTSPTAPVGYSDLRQEDTNLATQVTLPGAYDPTLNFIELVITSLDGATLQTVTGYVGAKQYGEASAAGKSATGVLFIDPILDAQVYGYTTGGVTLTYNFLNSLFKTSFFIREISADRTEIKIATTTDPYDVTSELETLLNKLNNQAYFDEFKLSFGNNLNVLGINIDQADDGDLLVKLYEPLPANLGLKSTFSLIEEVANPVAYQVDSSFTPQEIGSTYLKGPNFTIELEDQQSTSTEYLDYTTLFNYPVTSSYNELLTTLSASGVEVNIDYTDYTNFIHFSSATERLANFKYKLDLIELYETRRTETGSLSNAAGAVTSSNAYYDSLITGVISKFDGYEKYLYFQSSSYSWPKTNSVKPYINYSSTTPAATTWYNNQLATASLYDELNSSRLLYTVPEFIRQDDANAPYGLFVDMIAQHFDNVWVYTKAVTDKYDTDNRLDYGISRDLIEDVLKNFGVKLYSSNFSTANLSSLLLGEFYDSGSEQINSFVTASNEPTPDRDILSETYKRIYHNLPYLLKTKGTDRGLRALINCFGIPSGSLQIREFGGVERTDLPYFGPAGEVTDKIRLNHTGSIEGNTLSLYTNIQQQEYKYTQDNHIVEVGFSPTYYIDAHLTSSITASFNIDDYIGDPRTTHDSKYYSLQPFISSSLGDLTRYDVYDFVRLIKFFDNQLFKMIKDFIPARDTVATGIIIKPHLLERSKYAQPLPTGTRPEYSASIDTAFIEGTNGGTLAELNTSYTSSILQKAGYVTEINDTAVERINGELSGSRIQATTGELNNENLFKNPLQPECTYTVTQYLDGDGGITATNYLFGYPISTGNISVFWGTAKAGGNYVQYMKVHFQSGTGEVNFENSFRAGLTSITIGTTTYSPISINVGTQAAVLTFAEPLAGQSSLNPAVFPLINVQNVLMTPYLFERFDNSDYDVLMNNSSAVANSARVSKVDFGSGAIVPTNIEALRDNIADNAEVQEYLYNSVGMTSGRYIGKQLYGEELNEYNPATDRSYGQSPVIEQTVPYFGTFDQLYATPDIYNAVEVSVPYVTFENGDLFQTGLNRETRYDMQYIFTEDKFAEILVKSSPNTTNRFSTVNKEYRIKKGGKRLETLLNTQSGSINSAGRYISTPTASFENIFFGEDSGVAEYRMDGFFSGSVDRADQLTNSSTTNVYYITKTPAGSSADWDGSNNAYSLDIQAETPITYKSEVLLEFDRDGTGWGNDLSVDVILERYDGTSWSAIQTRTVTPSWNRYSLDWTQPEGIEIVGYYKESTGILKVFVKVTLNSGGLNGFGDNIAPEKLRTKIINNSSVNDDVFLLNYIKGFYNSVNDKYTVEFRNQGRTADLGGAIKVVFGPNFQNYPFDLRTEFKVAQDVLPQKVVAFRSQLTPPFAPAVTHPTASVGTSIVSSGSSSPYLWVSSSIGEVIGMTQNSDEVQTLGFREIITPLSFEIGDEIRMAGREEAVFTIVDIWTKSDSRLTSSSLLSNRDDKSLVLVVQPPVPYGTNNLNILIRRYVDDPTKVLLYDTSPKSLDEIGLITPKYITSNLRRNYEDYSTKAFTQIQ